MIPRTETKSLDSIAATTGLLVSARSLDEARIIVESGATWLDLKEPLHGPLGRPSHSVVCAVREYLESSSQAIHFSIAGGELRDWGNAEDLNWVRSWPRHVYFKLALSHCDVLPDWQTRLQATSQALQSQQQLILVHYADAKRCGAPGWEDVVEAAHHLGCSYVLIDTFTKTGETLLDHYPLERLRRCIEQARSRKLGIALAGSLRIDQLSALAGLRPDWVGVRGAVCQAERTGALSDRLVAKALQTMQDAMEIETA